MGALFGAGILNPATAFQHLAQRAASIRPWLVRRERNLHRELKDLPPTRRCPWASVGWSSRSRSATRRQTIRRPAGLCAQPPGDEVGRGDPGLRPAAQPAGDARALGLRRRALAQSADRRSSQRHRPPPAGRVSAQRDGVGLVRRGRGTSSAFGTAAHRRGADDHRACACDCHPRAGRGSSEARNWSHCRGPASAATEAGDFSGRSGCAASAGDDPSGGQASGSGGVDRHACAGGRRDRRSSSCRPCSRR